MLRKHSPCPETPSVTYRVAILPDGDGGRRRPRLFVALDAPDDVLDGVAPLDPRGVQLQRLAHPPPQPQPHPIIGAGATPRIALQRQAS